MLKPVRFVFCMIIMVIPSMLCFPSFLTISCRFPWCFARFPLVFLRFPQVFLLFSLSVSPVSYFRFCEATIWRRKKPQSNDKLYKEQCFPVITENWKQSSKQVAPIPYTLGKSCFCNCYFWRFVSCFLSDTFWSKWVLFAFLENR